MEGTGSSGQVPTTSSASGSSGAQEGCPAGCGADDACIDGTCEAVGRADIEAGCHPLGDPAGRGQCVYPWPSDFYTTPDAASATGLKVALPADLLPKNDKGALFPVDEMVNVAPGFSPNAQIRFALARPIDAGPLPGQADIGRSLLAPPNMPDDKFEALSKAFEAMLKDPEFLAEAEKRAIPVAPATAEQVNASVQKIFSTPPEVIDLLKTAMESGFEN